MKTWTMWEEKGYEIMKYLFAEIINIQVIKG